MSGQAWRVLDTLGREVARFSTIQEAGAFVRDLEGIVDVSIQEEEGDE